MRRSYCANELGMFLKLKEGQCGWSKKKVVRDEDEEVARGQIMVRNLGFILCIFGNYLEYLIKQGSDII